MRFAIFGLMLSALGGNAYAGGWSDYEQAFPLFPCPDGWTTCVVDGKNLGPGMVKDGQGNPAPAGLRFSFYSFDAMPSASPYSGLSEYNDEFGDARSLKDDVLADGDPAGGTAARQVEEIERDPPSYSTASDGRSLDGASPVRPSAPPTAPVPVDYGSETDRDAVPVPVPLPEPDVAPVPPVPPPLPPVDVARDSSGIPAVPKPDYGSGSTNAPSPPVVEPVKVVPVAPPPVPKIEPAAPPVPVVADAVTPPPPPPPPPVVDVSCDDLVALETAAMLGQLGVGRRKCLDAKIAREPAITKKNKISRVLISDAKQRGDKADWERLTKRHLEKIDRSDPDMCLLYAIHLHRKGVGKSTQVIKWADYALENKGKWTGALHIRNVYNLHKLKSQAASRLWKRAEKKFVAERNEKNEAASTRYRSMAKQFSRAWLEYAKAAGKNSTQAREACVSASGNTEFCPQ